MVEDVVFDGVGGGFGAGGEVEFAEERADVVADGFFAEENVVGDFFVGFAFGDEGHNVQFSVGEVGEGFVFGFAGSFADSVKDALGDGGVEEGVAASDGFEGADEFVTADLFEDVARGACGNGVEEEFIFCEGGENDDFGVGEFGGDFAGGFDAAFTGEADIHDYNVRFVSFDLLECFIG